MYTISTPWIESQCTYRCVVLPDSPSTRRKDNPPRSQCTYRCVVLPDVVGIAVIGIAGIVSMHLQVRGAP